MTVIQNVLNAVVGMITISGCADGKDKAKDNQGIDPADDTDDLDKPDDDTDIDDTGDIEYAYSWFGNAIVDGNSYIGTQNYFYDNFTTGERLCQYTYDALGVPFTRPAVCADPDGNPCEFTFDVTVSDGIETDGNCEASGEADDAKTYGYGFHSDFRIKGQEFGPMFMYYFEDAGWYPTYATASFDANTKEFAYAFPTYYY